MEAIEKLIIGLVIALLSAVIVYAFRVRQLYVVVPKMFRYSVLTEHGRILELRVFNRGRMMEEDVHIDMPPSLIYNLIAADHADVKLNDNKLILSRVAPLSEISIILMIEGSIQFESFIPTTTSKTTKGKLIRKWENVPANAGNNIVGIVLFILLLGSSFYGPKKWFEYQNKKQEEEIEVIFQKYAFLEKDGWRQLDSYILSDFRNNYYSNEFPIVLESVRRKKQNIEMQFLIINKSAEPFVLNAAFDSNYLDEPFPARTRGIYDVHIKPMQSASVTAEVQVPLDYPIEELFLRFNFRFANSYIAGLRFYPAFNKLTNKEIQQITSHNT